MSTAFKNFLKTYAPRIIVSLITALIAYIASGCELSEMGDATVDISCEPAAKISAIKAIAREAKSAAFDSHKIDYAEKIRDIALNANDSEKAQAIASLSELIEGMTFSTSKSDILEMIEEIVGV